MLQAVYRLLSVNHALHGHKLSFTAGQPFISLTGPSWRTSPGNPAPFNCTAGPFNSWDFNVTWMKGRDEHPASAQHLVTNSQGSYFVTSKVWVTLTLQDISLEITCQVTHRMPGEPLRKTMNLSQVLQGGWEVSVGGDVSLPSSSGFQSLLPQAPTSPPRWPRFLGRTTQHSH